MWSEIDNKRVPRPNAPAVDLANMTLAESIQRRFFPHLGVFDVFMSVGTRGSAVEPVAGNLTECEVLRPSSPSSALVGCDIYSELDLPVLKDSVHWRGYAFRTLEQPFLQQMYGIFRCHQSVKLHELRTGERYDYIVRLRLDTAMFSPMGFQHPDELNYGTRDHPFINIVGKSNCCCGNEDWFHIGERDPMGTIMDKFLHIQSLPPTPFMNSTEIWGPEAFTAHILVKEKACERPQPPAFSLSPNNPIESPK